MLSQNLILLFYYQTYTSLYKYAVVIIRRQILTGYVYERHDSYTYIFQNQASGQDTYYQIQSQT